MDREDKQYLHGEMSLEKAQKVRTLEYKYLYRTKGRTPPRQPAARLNLNQNPPKSIAIFLP